MDEVARENDEIRAYADKVMVRETELRMAREREQNAKDAILEQLSAEMSARQVRRRSLLLWCGAERSGATWPREHSVAPLCGHASPVAPPRPAVDGL